MKIDKYSKVFESGEFLKDKYMFSIILLYLDNKDLKLYSDEKSYIISYTGGNHPSWIWTKDNFDESKLSELEHVMEEHYLNLGSNGKFTCKRELYDMIRNSNYFNIDDDIFEEGVYVCNNTIKPKEVDGKLELAGEEDKELLYKYLYDMNKEIEGIPDITMEESRLKIDESIKDETMYVWKVDGEIVAMAKYKVVDDFAKVGSAYTVPSYRSKGYIQNVIYGITNVVKEKGYVPMLYTDLNFVVSNKAYMKVGYEFMGSLVEFKCSIKDK